jgi:hypothetical protein
MGFSPGISPELKRTTKAVHIPVAPYFQVCQQKEITLILILD